MTWPGRTLVFALLAFPVAYLIGGIAVYAIRDRLFGSAPVDSEIAKRGESALLGRTLRQGFAWTAAPVERWILASGATPDALTWFGCAVCCTGALAIAAGDLTIGGMLVLSSAGFDYLDGRVARQRGKASPAGEFLDSTLDRFSDAACFAAAAFLFRERPLALAAALVATGAASIVPYARAKAEGLGLELKGGLMQRPERIVIYSAAAIFAGVLDGLWPVSLRDGHPTFALVVAFLAVATAATAATRTRDGWRALRRRGTGSAAPLASPASTAPPSGDGGAGGQLSV